MDEASLLPAPGGGEMVPLVTKGEALPPLRPCPLISGGIQANHEH